jgi:hypothetical protein
MKCRDEQILSEFCNLKDLYWHLKSEIYHLAPSYPYYSRNTEYTDNEKRLQKTATRMAGLIHIAEAMKTVWKLSSTDFEQLIEFLTHEKPYTSEIVCQPDLILKTLISKHNFTIQLGGIPLPCNRVIAASISKVIAR